MNAGQPCQRYSGVTRHANRWLAKFRSNGRDLNLGHFEDPELAAWVADFARYMCFGLNPAMWHHQVGKPNFPPTTRDDFPRVLILQKLLESGLLSIDKLQERVAAFDAVVERKVARCACGYPRDYRGG